MPDRICQSQSLPIGERTANPWLWLLTNTLLLQARKKPRKPATAQTVKPSATSTIRTEIFGGFALPFAHLPIEGSPYGGKRVGPMKG
jgi:hypothetical protein